MKKNEVNQISGDQVFLNKPIINTNIKYLKLLLTD
jgi:hypothetical protein